MGARLLAVASFFVALLACTGSSAQDAAPFEYRFPPGFVDLSKDAPAENRKGQPDALLEHSRKFDRYGVVFDAEKLWVGEVASSLLASHGSLSSVADNLANGTTRLGAKVLGRSTERIAGFECPLLELESRVEGQPVRRAIYVLPLGNMAAVISFEARAEDFVRLRDAFDASVMAARGLSPVYDQAENNALLPALFSLLGAGGVIGNAARKRRRANRLKRGR